VNISYADSNTVGTRPGFVFQNPFGSKNTSLWDFVIAIVNFILNIALAVVVLYIIYAGFMFITAQGKEEALRTAKRNLWGAIIGALLIMGGKILVVAICSTAKDVGLVTNVDCGLINR
jgi:amino acid transporter